VFAWTRRPYPSVGLKGFKVDKILSDGKDSGVVALLVLSATIKTDSDECFCTSCLVRFAFPHLKQTLTVKPVPFLHVFILLRLPV
jgi:hypothetical protein